MADIPPRRKDNIDADARSRSPAPARDETVVPVLREELDVHRRRADTGRGVRVRKKIEQEERSVDEALTREDVEVERVAIGRPVTEPVAVRYEGDTIIVPVLEEVLVVEKRLVLKEEIRITRRKSEFRNPQRVTLRREVAAVERIEAPGTSELTGSPAPQPDARSADTLLDDRRREQEALRRSLDDGSHEKP